MMSRTMMLELSIVGGLVSLFAYYDMRVLKWIGIAAGIGVAGVVLSLAWFGFITVRSISRRRL